LNAKLLKYKLNNLNAGVSPPRPGSDALTRDELILKYAPLIKFIAHRLALRLPAHITVDDLISAGVIGLMDALDKFDAGKNVQFKTYAEFRIKGAMIDELRSLDWVPRSIRQKASQFEKAYMTLEKRQGGSVDDEDLARELNLSMESYHQLVGEISGISLLDAGSLRRRTAGVPDEELLESLASDDTDSDPYERFRVDEIKRILAQAIGELTDKEKTVVSLYYYDELTLKEIGEVLGFTESRICQIHTKAILKLRARVKAAFRDAD
jgi:RNA polymerase sigma factor FliA